MKNFIPITSLSKQIFLALAIGTILLGCSTASPTNLPPTSPTTLPTQSLPTPTIRPTDHPTIRPPASKPVIQTPAWFNDVVLYEIFPRSFNDTNGDGIGDLKGITQKLDYLKNLGVGALWLTPIHPSPSYHGYDITDYFKINPEFGTEEDLIELVNEAHKRDMKIILDFVAGHTSKQHPFFQDAFGNPKSKYAKWYRWLNDTHTKYEHFGTATSLPSLDQDNPDTRAYLMDAAKYWIDKANIDGYRLDFALGPSHDFWKAFRAEIKTFRGSVSDFLLLGEVWTSGLKIAPYYDNEFDATFDFPVYFDLMGSHERAGKSALLGKGSPSAFQSSLKAQTRLYHPGAQSVRFLNNHDTVRAMSQLNDTQRAKLAATLLLTLPGTPMIYYGEEIGMRGDKTDGDKSVREPMDWHASENGAGMTTWNKPAARFNTANDGVSVEEQENNKDSLLEHYRALIALRAKYPTLRAGEFVALPLQGNPKAIAFLRRDENETFIVFLNSETQPVTMSLDAQTIQEAMNGFTDELTGAFIPPPVIDKYALVVSPLSAHLLRVKK